MSAPEHDDHNGHDEAPVLERAGEVPAGGSPSQVEGPAEVDLSRQRLLELLEQGRGPAVGHDVAHVVDGADPAGPLDPADPAGRGSHVATLAGDGFEGGGSGGAGGASGGAGGSSSQTLPAQPRCPDVQTWVTTFFAPVFVRRATPMFKWCAQWWRHPEAVVRLEALWRSWEVLRLDPGTGGGVWLRDYLDVQLASLTGSAGPFADCDPTRHHQAPTSLRLEAAPAGWFPAPQP